jgi:hypothetical protein
MRIKLKDLPPDVQAQVKAQIAAEDRQRYAGVLESIIPEDRKGMNKTEWRYADHLDNLIRLGEVKEWAFEADKLTLGHRCTYTPDFRVTFADGRIEYHEVKGFWRDDARVKIKVAARLNPQTMFKAVKWVNRQWVYELIPSGAG